MAEPDPELLDVRIVAFPTTLEESPVIGLKRVFGIDEVAASRLIGNLPAVVQRGVPLVRAEYFRRALELIGAVVEVRTRDGELVPAPEPEPEPEPALAPVARTPVFAAAADVTLREGMAALPRPGVMPPAAEAGPGWSGLDLGDPPGPGRLEPLELAPQAGRPRPDPLALDLPEPPAAVRERRPDAPILPGEVPPSNPPRTASSGSSSPPARSSRPPPPGAGRGPVTRSSRPPRAMGARRAAPAAPRPAAQAAVLDTRSFWQSLGDALALPWLGRGAYWLLALLVWSTFASLLIVVAQGLALPIVPLVIGALGALTLMGFAADGFVVAFRCVRDGAPFIAQAPSFDPARIVTHYVLSALHLMLFALVSNVPVILWCLKQAEGGASLSSTLLHPVTFLLWAFPGFYWPAALTAMALHGNFSGVWRVHVGLRAMVSAPLEYFVCATIGALAFCLSAAVLGLFGMLLDLPPALGLAALGLPLGASHLLWGSLLGHLSRARPEAFEP